MEGVLVQQGKSSEVTAPARSCASWDVTHTFWGRSAAGRGCIQASSRQRDSSHETLNLHEHTRAWVCVQNTDGNEPEGQRASESKTEELQGAPNELHPLQGGSLYLLSF